MEPPYSRPPAQSTPRACSAHFSSCAAPRSPYRMISAGSSRAGAGRSLFCFTAQPQELGDAAGWLLSQPVITAANPTAKANSETLSRIP